MTKRLLVNSLLIRQHYAQGNCHSAENVGTVGCIERKSKAQALTWLRPAQPKLINGLITMNEGLLNGSVVAGNEQSVITAGSLSDNPVFAEPQAICRLHVFCRFQAKF